MKITCDHEVDALYIRFKETTVTTKRLAEGIAADYDAAGLSPGEILDHTPRFGWRTSGRRPPMPRSLRAKTSGKSLLPGMNAKAS